MKQFLVYLKNGMMAVVKGDKIKLSDEVYWIGNNTFNKETVKMILEDVEYQKDKNVLERFR